MSVPPDESAQDQSARLPEFKFEAPVLEVRSFADHVARPVEFLRPGVPIGNVTTVCGDGGLGKTMLVLSWAVEVARAGDEVLLVVVEDGADVAKYRLRALDADDETMRRIHFVSVTWGVGADGEADYDAASLRLPEQAVELDAHVASFEGRLRLLVIDPWAENLGDSVDSHQAKSLRTAIAALRNIAARHRLAAVVIAHLNKTTSGNLKKRIDGSGALYDGSRSVFLFAREQPPDDETGSDDESPRPASDDRRVLVHDKCNVAPLLEARAYVMEGIDVPAHGVEPATRTARIVLVPGAEGYVSASTADLLADDRPAFKTPRIVGRPAVEREAARGFLLAVLRDRKPQARAGLLTLAATEGISERTLRRAYRDLADEGFANRGERGIWRLLPLSQTPAAAASDLGHNPDGVVGSERDSDSKSSREAASEHEAVGLGPEAREPVPSFGLLARFTKGDRVRCHKCEAPKRVDRVAAGLVYLSCGCSFAEADRS